MVSLYSPSQNDSAGVQKLFTPEGQPADTSEAAAQAVQPQNPGDEFRPLPNPDVVALVKRLKALDKRSTEICDALWSRQPPPGYDEREELQEEQHAVDIERNSVQYQLQSIYEGTNDSDGGGPAVGNVVVIGSDANNS